MVIRLKKPVSLINASTSKAVKKFATLAFSAVLLSSCVGTDSASVFDGVQSTQTTQQTAQNNLPAGTSNQSATLPTNLPNSLPNTTPTTSSGFRSVPIGRKLPAPVSATNYLPSHSSLVPGVNNQPVSNLAANNLGIEATNPNTIQVSPTTKALALRSLDDNSNEQTSLQLATISTPVIDPVEAAAHNRISPLYRSISHGKCKDEWAPQPKRVEAKRINQGDPFYIEIRMRNTPLMPVGHTFIAYGKLDGNGKPTSERLAMLAPLGGYAGAGIAAAIPVPGVLTPYGDDCKIRAETAYRVSLSAQRYEKLLLAIKKAKDEKPVYMLFAQNCNHFMQRMADSVGIKPPKNKYVPAVEYLYDLIEANEGIKINTRYRSKIAGVGDWPSPNAIKNQRSKARANNDI